MPRIHKSEQHQSLETLAVLAAFLLLLNLLTHRQWLVPAALILLAVGLFVRPLARLLSKGWLGFAGVLGAFNSKLILALVFYLFLTPLAFLYRLFTKNPLQLKNDQVPGSLYIERGHHYSAADFEKMW